MTYFDIDGLRPLNGTHSTGSRSNVKKEEECENEEECSPSVDIRFRGVCDGQDPMCAAGLKAAGIEGPYFSETITYDVRCLLTFGLLFKGGTGVAATVALEKAPRALVKNGFPALGRTAGTVASVVNSPVGIGVSVVVGVSAIFEACECE